MFISFRGFCQNTDEVAKHIGISKRTLYCYYDTKEKLTNVVFNFLKERITTQHETIIKYKNPTLRFHPNTHILFFQVIHFDKKPRRIKSLTFKT
ncbi:TetR/AcrR family transcriptional regulator [Leptospira santarosai]|uniref:TetR/AcrR family transcriptional regulator n=1 Tax=Leptospira santarosai TaxID=28183 RepID=UPI000BB9C13E|nr:TetR/AcrR family transcriptional regulator [Leptospira santarosai]ASV13422.1 TetR family transcriptional regulator [Leptospira santarosai]MDO6381805.1 TetR/AcrR family transcriptional regulator [Leptospira santarosai]